ncbi:MAG: hypothetical protein ABIX12_06275, partial [Rubrivivax sp.]
MSEINKTLLPYRLGRIPDKADSRDKIFSARRARTLLAAALPKRLDLRKNHYPVRDQGGLGCHDDKTEVLTDRGWALFSALDGRERLATVDPSTGELTYEAPTKLLRFPYSGEMVCATNQSLDFMVTPNHRMLVRKWDEAARTLRADYQMVEASELGWYCGLMNRVKWAGESASDTYTLPGVDHKHMEQRSPKEVPMAAWLRFLGIYAAEGTMLKPYPGSPYRVQIAASKEREKGFVRTTLAELGLHALEYADRFAFHNMRVYKAMEGLGLFGVKAGQKRVPGFVFRQPSSMIAEYLAGHFAGDGCEQRGLRSHYTGSVGLADDLQLLAFLSGQESRISVRAARTSMMADGRMVVGSLPQHRVSICERKNLSIERKESVRRVQYDGDVFCAEVPTHHTLVTRRNGKVLVSGNSCVGHGATGAFRKALRKGKMPDQTGSTLAAYYFARELEGTTSQDVGASVRDGLKGITKRGAPHEQLWPYIESRFDDLPSGPALEDGLLHLGVEYQRVDSTKRADCKAALALNGNLVIGIAVFASFMDVGRNGRVPMPKPGEELLG